jgi:hypothetical protein
MGAMSDQPRPNRLLRRHQIHNRAGEIRQGLMQMGDQPFDAFSVCWTHACLMLDEILVEYVVHDAGVTTAKAHGDEATEEVFMLALLRYAGL